MDVLVNAWRYALDNWSTFSAAVVTQIQLSGAALCLALLICLPLGVLAARNRWISLVSVNLVGTARVIPSIAILFLALPILGFGFQPALVALTVLACPPILVNTSTGLAGVDPAIIEAAAGMGMSRFQVLVRVQIPLAVPVILAGIRTATVEVIASATLATFIGGGGLGDFIAEGFSTNDTRLMLVGAIPVAAMALCAELIFSTLQRALTTA